MIERIATEIRHGALAAALFAALIAPASGVGAQATGTITGVVSTGAAMLKPLRITMDNKVCGDQVPDESVVIDGNRHLANAVISVVGLKKSAAAANPSVMNEKCRFSPHVQVVRPNGTITTSSKDPILHTTNAQFENGKTLFNVAVPVPGLTIPRQLNGTGVVRLSCNTHPWMRGWVIVTDDLSVVTAANGSFTLADVPAGTYELRVWHEALKGAPQKVTVAAGQTATVNFELK